MKDEVEREGEARGGGGGGRGGGQRQTGRQDGKGEKRVKRGGQVRIKTRARYFALSCDVLF